DLFLGFFLPQPKKRGQRIVTPVYYDYSGRLDYNLHENGRLSVFAIGSSDTLHVLNRDPDAALSTDLNTAVKFFRVIGTYERVIAGVGPRHADVQRRAGRGGRAVLERQRGQRDAVVPDARARPAVGPADARL